MQEVVPDPAVHCARPASAARYHNTRGQVDCPPGCPLAGNCLRTPPHAREGATMGQVYSTAISSNRLPPRSSV